LIVSSLDNSSLDFPPSSDPAVLTEFTEKLIETQVCLRRFGDK
jgi:hypothetical protein